MERSISDVTEASTTDKSKRVTEASAGTTIRDLPQSPKGTGLSKNSKTKPPVSKKPAVTNRPKDPITNVNEPPLMPTKSKKKDVIPTAFDHIDTHAKQAPGSVCSTVSTLAQYLVRPASNDMEKVRGIYMWIAENIRFDTASCFTGNFGQETSDVVLKKRYTLSCGYARLFHDLCKEVGIPSKFITGFSKSSKHDPKNAFTKDSQANHAWNIVFIDGEWRPIEVTWAAGCLKSDNRFKKQFEFHFLPDPEDFIEDHFPYVDTDLTASLPLQLLEQHVTLESFNTAVNVQTVGIKWGFELLSHSSQVITMDKECLINFRTRKVHLQNIACELIEINSKEDFKQYVLLRKKGEVFSAKLTPPAEGKYDLRFFGQPAGSTDNRLDWMISLTIVCQSVTDDVRPYPDKSDFWGANPDAKRYGFTDDIFEYDVINTTNGEIRLQIRTVKQIPVALKLCQAGTGDSVHSFKSDLQKFIFEYYDGNVLVINARFPDVGFFKLTLFAKDLEQKTNNNFDHVADFLIDSRTSTPNTQPFPATRPHSQEYGCLLLEPLTRYLPANEDVRLRLRSAQLMRIYVNKLLCKKGDSDEFDITFKTPSSGQTVGVYGSPNAEGTLWGLFVFTVI